MKRAFLIATALGACAPTTVVEEPAPATPAVPGTCDAATVQDLVGKPAATHTAEAKSRSGANTVRSYTSGSAVTMDYRQDRLNVERDAAGTIVRLTCG